MNDGEGIKPDVQPKKLDPTITELITVTYYRLGLLEDSSNPDLDTIKDELDNYESNLDLSKSKSLKEQIDELVYSRLE